MMERPKYYKKDYAGNSLPNSPYDALVIAWEDEDPVDFIFHEINYWFYVALSNESSVYNHVSINERATFVEFFSDLLPLIEATYCATVRYLYGSKTTELSDLIKTKWAIEQDLGRHYEPVFLNDDHIAEPLLIVNSFCSKYPLRYARRELWDLLDAAQCYNGSLRKKISPMILGMKYSRLLTMVDAAYCIALPGGGPDFRESAAYCLSVKL